MKHTQQLDSDSRAVSPVIGVVLMVGIVVALGAVVGAAVLGLGVGVGDTAPNAQFDVSTDQESGVSYVVVEHQAGETIDSERFEYALNGDTEVLTTDSPGESFPNEVSAGDTARLTNDIGFDAPESGDIFTLRWVSEDGETSSVLVEEELEFE